MKFIKAEDLPRMDTKGVLGMGGTGDPYIWIDHLGNTMSSKVVTMELDEARCTDDQEFFKPVVWN
jgi:DUF917 family protein